MGGGSITDAKLVAVGSGAPAIGDSEGKGFYTIDGNNFIQVTEPSFDQAPFTHNGIGFNTTDDINEPKWAVVGDPINQDIDTSNTGFYSSNGIDWNMIQDVSFFWNDICDNGYGWNSIASDGSKNWVAVGTKLNNFANIQQEAITTSSIETANSWNSFIIGDGNNTFHTYNAVDYNEGYWICVGQRFDDQTANNILGGVWASPNITQPGGWSFVNDTSNINYDYKGVGHDTSGRWMVVGEQNGINSGKAFYSVRGSNPVDSSWTPIDNSSVDASSTSWNDADYSPDHDRWVIVGSDNFSFPPKAKIVYNDSGDLSSWHNADISSNPDLSGFHLASSVVWDNTFNKFFCAGSLINSSFSSSGVIAESSNGIFWQKTGTSYDDISGLTFNAIATSSPN